MKMTAELFKASSPATFHSVANRVRTLGKLVRWDAMRCDEIEMPKRFPTIVAIVVLCFMVMAKK